MQDKKYLEWWNSFSFEDQFYLVIEWLQSKGEDTTSRHPNRLSVAEICEIYDFFFSASI